jgi:hypothetical protein
MIQSCTKLAKWTLFLLSIMLTMIACAPDVVVTLNTDHETYSPYQEIYCTLKVKNCGSDTIVYTVPNDELCCGYWIEYADGQKLMSGGFGFGGYRTRVLAPGDSSESDAMLDGMFVIGRERVGLIGSYRPPGQPEVVARIEVYGPSDVRRKPIAIVEGRRSITILPPSEHEQSVVDSLIDLSIARTSGNCMAMLDIIKRNPSIPSHRTLFFRLTVLAFVERPPLSRISWECVMAYPDYPRLKEQIHRLKPDSTFLHEVRISKQGTRLYDLLKKKGWL